MPKFMTALANFFEVFFIVVFFNVLLSSTMRDQSRSVDVEKMISDKFTNLAEKNTKELSELRVNINEDLH